MSTSSLTDTYSELGVAASQPNWLRRAMLLWKYRAVLSKVTAASLLLSLCVAFSIPKQYVSTTRIMPPDQQSGPGALMFAALASHTGSLGGLGALASSLMGGHTTTALFINLLHSGTISSHLIDNFHLQQVYHKRYRIDTAKRLAHRTTITDDKKSGVITIEVEDTDPVRARDIAQGYLDELNKLVNQTSTSSAHRERIFIEQRLQSVKNNLEQAQLALSEFSSKSNAIDIKEQTRAMVDAGARVQGELLVEQAGLQSLRQIYGDGNVRIRETEARIASLRRELENMAGTSASSTPEVDGKADISSNSDDKGELYPPLRQIPKLAVPYADLYRRVRVQETVFELLTQQYELARIDEAKDIPVISVIDPPGIPEKKSFPPRLLLTLLLTAISFSITSVLILMREHWSKLKQDDPRKTFAEEIFSTLRNRGRSIFAFFRRAA